MSLWEQGGIPAASGTTHRRELRCMGAQFVGSSVIFRRQSLPSASSSRSFQQRPQQKCAVTSVPEQCGRESCPHYKAATTVEPAPFGPLTAALGSG